MSFNKVIFYCIIGFMVVYFILSAVVFFGFILDGKNSDIKWFAYIISQLSTLIFGSGLAYYFYMDSVNEKIKSSDNPEES